MSNIVVDDKKVLAMFAEMDKKNRNRVFRTALRQSAAILVRQTKKNFRSIVTSNGRLRMNTPNKWNGKKMEQGIKTSMARDARSVKVHLLGDFRLKFFEMGTKDRYTKGHKITGRMQVGRKWRLIRSGRGGYRGRIEAGTPFRSAKTETESRIFKEMDERFTRQIIRVNEKYK